MNIDESYAAFSKVRIECNSNINLISTEEDARYHVINRMLREVLGWPDRTIKNEPHVEDGFIDYLFVDAERNHMVIEAKKVSSLLIDIKSSASNSYKVNGPALRASASAIRQAEQYCLKTGAPYCGITNGLEWIAHWCMRGDGRPKDDYKAIVFPSLEAIDVDFARFYELFSYQGVLEKCYKVRINEAEGLKVTAGEKLRAIRDPRHQQHMKLSDLARDLDSVFRAFFSSMSGDDDPEMLAQCFVESKESRNAEASLNKIARNLVDRISMVEDARATGLQEEIRDAVNRTSKEFVLIVGNKGSGKSTFIDRFFDITLEKGLRERCLLLRVNLLDADGDEDRIQAWLTERLIERVEKALFPKEFLDYQDLIGVFHRQYKQWSEGEHKHLYSSDKNAFRQKFGDYMHAIRNGDKPRYLSDLLWHATGARQLMPCLVFDNTDHYSQEFQEKVFQYAQSIHRTVFSFVICPITDRTIWQLSKFGPLQSYDTKAFYLPVPSTKEVLEKRVAFIKNQLTNSKRSDSYFLNKGIKLSIADINAFATCIEEVFIQTEYVARTISWLCNFDIRRSLVLTQRVLSSPHVSVDDLVRTFLSGGRLRVQEHTIRKALFLGDYTHFNQESNAFILNVFGMVKEEITSPFLRLSILQLLKDKDASKDDSDQAYLEVGEISAYLDAMGFSPAAVVKNCVKLLDYRCVEPYDPTTTKLQENTRLKITASGLIHMEFAVSDPTYLEHVGLSTEVREASAIDQIRTIFKSRMGPGEWREACRLFGVYCVQQDKIFAFLPNEYEGQLFFRQEFCTKWGVSDESTVS